MNPSARLAASAPSAPLAPPGLPDYYPYDGDSDHSASASTSEDEEDDDDLDSMGQRRLQDERRQRRGEYTELKEQMYRDKLAELKEQLRQLREWSLPEYAKRLRRIEALYRERRRVNEVIRDLEAEMVERDVLSEKKAAAREFEEHKVYLREQLIAELEEKQKMIESERHGMELSGDAAELKPISTRKLRRRANEPSNSVGYGPGEKRRKPTTMPLQYQLDDSDILDDLKIINKNKAFSMQKHSSNSTSSSSGTGGGGGAGSGADSAPSAHFPVDVRVEDGKLFYQKRWFRRGQAVLVEPKSGDKMSGMISAIGSDAIWVRRTGDNYKMRIYLAALAKGKFVIKRRAA